VASNNDKQTERTSREARAIAIDYRLRWEGEGAKKQQRYTGAIAVGITIPAGCARRLKSRKAKRYYKAAAGRANGDSADRSLNENIEARFVQFSVYLYFSSPFFSFVISAVL